MYGTRFLTSNCIVTVLHKGTGRVREPALVSWWKAQLQYSKKVGQPTENRLSHRHPAGDSPACSSKDSEGRGLCALAPLSCGAVAIWRPFCALLVTIIIYAPALGQTRIPVFYYK